jgi:hypothetical protein
VLISFFYRSETNEQAYEHIFDYNILFCDVLIKSSTLLGPKGMGWYNNKKVFVSKERREIFEVPKSPEKAGVSELCQRCSNQFSCLLGNLQNVKSSDLYI